MDHSLSNSVKLWAMSFRATQDRWVMVESSDKTWSTGEGNGRPLQYSYLENPWTVWKGKKILHWKMNSQVGRCPKYATGEDYSNNSGKNEETGPKAKKQTNKQKKKHSAVDVTGAGSKAWCCKEQYCIGIWNVRSMNQGKLEVVKQEMTRVNIDILAISELKWTRMGEFNSDDHYIYYCGQESLLRNGVAITVNKRVWNAVLGFNLKKDISCPSCVPSPPLQGHQCYHWSMWCFGVLLAPICIQLICIGYRCSMG